MDWTRAVDGYCERIDPSLWAEPLNAISNLAFILAALVMWLRTRNQGMPLAVWLCVVLAAIGVFSGAFHTWAVVGTAVLDSLSILVFILLYIFAANRDYWHLSFWPALGVTALFFPYAAALVPVFQLVPGLGGSAAYGPVPLLILIYSFLLRHRAPETARGMALGAVILVVSLTFRTLDLPLCSVWPSGTHIAWHLLNGLMLGWMIEVYRRHRLREAAQSNPPG